MPTGQDRLPIGPHPRNPRYFLWRGQPTALITSGEHYGAVLNADFAPLPYLCKLKAHGFNLTRTFTGVYCEAPGDFGIAHNPLAPAQGWLICPWARSEEPGYAGGGNKFDLSRWDEAYFRRVCAFVAAAGEQGVVVELVLFCTFYEGASWPLSPMNAANNINGIGDVERHRVYTLEDAGLTAVQTELTRKIVGELAPYDNLYYELCNEPYIGGGASTEWHAHIAETIAAAEAGLGQGHMMAWNVANGTARIVSPHPRVSLYNFHYASPPDAVAQNWDLNVAIGDNETGFRGSEPKPYRQEAWGFLLAGGSLFNNLDYSFWVGHEDGSGEIAAPGGGGNALRHQLEVLRDYVNRLDLLVARPAQDLVLSVEPDGVTARALAEEGRTVLAFLVGQGPATLTLDLAAGDYALEWVDTPSGEVSATAHISHSGGACALPSPPFAEDTACYVTRLAP